MNKTLTVEVPLPLIGALLDSLELPTSRPAKNDLADQLRKLRNEQVPNKLKSADAFLSKWSELLEVLCEGVERRSEEIETLQNEINDLGRIVKGENK